MRFHNRSSKSILALLALVFCISTVSADWVNDWVDLEVDLIAKARGNVFRNIVPPVLRGILGAHEAMYNAWAAFQKNSLSVEIDQPVVRFKQTGSPTTRAIRVQTAVSYATYRAMKYFYQGSPGIPTLDAYFASTTANKPAYNNLTVTEDLNDPIGVGNYIGRKVIEKYEFRDGTNADGLDPRGTPPVVPPSGPIQYQNFSDTSNYDPFNPKFGLVGGLIPKTDGSELDNRFSQWNDSRSHRHYQPATNGHLNWTEAAFCNRNLDFLTGTAEFLPEAPARLYTNSEADFLAGYHELAEYSHYLDDRNKTIAFFFQVGNNTSPAGILIGMASNVSYIKGYTVDESIPFLYMVGAAIESANSVGNLGKRYFDTPRPTNIIQYFFKNETFHAWKGPYLGHGNILGKDWTANVPTAQVQNSGPEYPAGASTIYGSGAQIIRLFTKSDTFFGSPFVVGPGGITTEVQTPSQPLNTGYGTTGSAPATQQTLSWNTWTDLTDMCTQGRALLGVHLIKSCEAGNELGIKVANRVFESVNSLIDGKYPDVVVRRHCEKFNLDPNPSTACDDEHCEFDDSQNGLNLCVPRK